MGIYVRLVDHGSQKEKEDAFLSAVSGKDDSKILFNASESDFSKIPGSPVAYWVSERFIAAFENSISIDTISDFTGSQHITADNDKYLRSFWEVNDDLIGQGKTWAFYAKGGEFRKWYGNTELLVKCDRKALQFYKTNPTSNCLAPQYWFTEGITYSAITSKGTGFRYYPAIGAFDKGGATICHVRHLHYILALLNTKLAKFMFDLLNPTINLQVKDIKALPIIINQENEMIVNDLSRQNVQLSKTDWDAYETSWDFKRHPLI